MKKLTNKSKALCGACLTLSVLTTAAPVLSEVTFGVYGGYQDGSHSGVLITGDPIIEDIQFTAGWEGRPFSAPPYYGLRATWWTGSDWGFGLDINHAKVYADDETLAASGLEHFEFSDGLNYVTLNAYRRWTGAWDQGTSPYLGVGLGAAVPHVEVTQGASHTFEYQLTGPAIVLMAGVERPLNDNWTIFGEYKFGYSQNSVSLSSGGTLDVDIVTNAINVGVSYAF